MKLSGEGRPLGLEASGSGIEKGEVGLSILSEWDGFEI
jgi:hypothetical protein